MAKAIKSWHSAKMNWWWHAKEDCGGGRYFGYVEGWSSEWGYFTESDLATAGAVEVEPHEIDG